MTADRNLLFGILALQNDFVTRDQLVEAMNAWVLARHRPLGGLLRERGALAAEEFALLDALVTRQLAKHAGDVEQSILALSPSPTVRQALARVADLQASFQLVSDATTDHVAAPEDAALRFRVLRPHARGGLGEVFVAEDTQLHREVALKEIQAHYAGDPPSRGRFLLEAEVTGRLEHPGIVPVYGLGTYADGRPYYAMRFIKGDNLKHAIGQFHRGPVDFTAVAFRQLLRRFFDVCNAVAYAHSRGVLHRDLKPGNIMLGEFGETLVVDWGLAKVVGRTSEVEAGDGTLHPEASSSVVETVAGTAIGTPAYMSPEQAEGKVDQLGPATDVYSLGATLYCLLTGQPPVAGADVVAVLERVRRGDVVPANVARPGVPPALAAVCKKAMAVRQEDRYAGALDLAADVEHWLADEPVSAYREGVGTRLRRWARRHRPVVAGLLTGLAAVVVAGAVGGVWYARHQEAARREAERVRNEVAQRQAAGLAAARGGDVAAATRQLSEAVGLCQEEDKAAELIGQLQCLERYQAFRVQAAHALRHGAHNTRGRRDPGQPLQEAERALAVYDVEAREDWLAAADPAVLTADQLAEVKRLANELLVLTALRLAMFDTRDAAGRANTARGLRLLDRAAGVESPTFGIWMLRMLWHRRLGDNVAADRAGDQMTLAAKEGRQTARDLYLLGSFTLQVSRKPAEAARAYRRALALEPNHYGANFGLFLCASEVKDDRGQLAPLSACLALRPEDPELYYFRGMAYFGLGQTDLAWQDFDASVRRDPTFKTGCFYRGRMLVIQDKWADAEADFTRALDLDPAFTQGRTWRAVARAKVGRHQDAAADAEECVRREPKDALTAFFAARAYAQAVAAAKSPADADRYGGRAVELLTQAAALGFKDLNRVGAGSDFDPVRPRADFKQFQAKTGAP